MRLFSLQGQAAMGTGCNKGLGQEIALALAEASADIVGVSRRPAEETRKHVEALGQRVYAIEPVRPSIYAPTPPATCMGTPWPWTVAGSPVKRQASHNARTPLLARAFRTEPTQRRTEEPNAKSTGTGLSIMWRGPSSSPLSALIRNTAIVSEFWLPT